MKDLVHMSGAGNTFIVGSSSTKYTAEEIRQLIASNPRQDQLPVEGVLALRHTSSRSFVCDYYNPDGSQGMMCGNGARCIVRFATDNGVLASSPVIDFSLNEASYTASIDSGLVTISLPAPWSEREFKIGELDGVSEAVYYVDVNSDHVVIDGPIDASKAIVAALRHHAEFPRGTNVNMCSGLGSSSIVMATFERGVEAITGACGTGAVAAAIAGWRVYGGPDTVELEPPSKRLLSVTIHHLGSIITSIDLIGDAQYD